MVNEEQERGGAWVSHAPPRKRFLPTLILVPFLPGTDVGPYVCLGRFRPGRGGQEDAAIPPSTDSQWFQVRVVAKVATKCV
jgi:hypothetical protein